MSIVGVHPPSDPGPFVQDFREQTGVTFPLVVDQGETLYRVALPRGTAAPYPRDLVIDQDLVSRSNKNSFDAVEMQQLIDELLAR